MKRIFVLLFLIVCISGCDKPLSESQGLSDVRYIVVNEHSIPLATDLPGRVSALSLSEVRPQVDGIILERLFEEGSDVRKGQILYQIDAALYRAERDTAKATLAEAKARVALLARQETRHSNLARTKAVSQQDLDTTIAEHKEARARVDRARAELERAEINLAHTRVLAHASGRIGISNVSPGALVTANQERPLAVIQEIDKVYVDMTKASADILRLRLALSKRALEGEDADSGVRLTLENGVPYARQKPDADADQQLIYGKLLFTDISVGQNTGSVTLRAIFENPDGLLLPGMYVTVTLEEGVERAILVPQKSVFSSGSGRHSVFVLRPQAGGGDFLLERKDIQLERSYGNAWVVGKGLHEGELVLVEGLQRAKPGERVRGVEEKTPFPTLPVTNSPAFRE